MHPNPSQNQSAIATPRTPSSRLLSKTPTTFRPRHGPYLANLTSTTNEMTATTHSHRTRAKGIKKSTTTAADDLMKQVAQEKRIREEKKKMRQIEKKEEEDRRKAEKEAATLHTEALVAAISPPADSEDQQSDQYNLPVNSPVFTMTTDELTVYAKDTKGMTEEEKDSFIAYVQDRNQEVEFEEMETQLMDPSEAEDHQARHGIQRNNLFGNPSALSEEEEPVLAIDLTENSPTKKKPKGATATGAQKPFNRYTTNSFKIPSTAHVHTHPLTFVEAAICLTSEDKPKEFIVAIKLLLKNAKFLDPTFGLAPLKNLPGKQTKLILAEEDVPTNFTHLGQYAFTSGNRIFEKKKNWNNGAKQPHRDREAEDFKDPVVYFTIAIATDVPPRALIDGIRTEWETHGGGKLQVKDLQSHESKTMFALYYVYKDTPFHIIKKTLDNILTEAAWMMHYRKMLSDDGAFEPTIPQISIRSQVPRLKGVDSSSFDKLPYHVRENRKVLHIEAKPEDEKELKDMFQFAKERSLVALRLGKRAHISEVMDAESNTGEIKRMVKYAMGHANYQGSMTGETIVGISLLDGGASPSLDSSDTVSLRMVLFTYFKMADKFSVFAELHQTEEMGPVLAIIPACEEAERLVQMMNKQVAAFLFYFLREASLPEKFLMDLLTETCDPTLVGEISECEWDKNTQTITTPREKKEDKDIDDLEAATWYKQAFDLRGLGAAMKPATNKAPEDLFDLDAEQSIKTIHNRHLKPTFTLEDDDDDSEGSAPAANPRPATPPRKSTDKEATSKQKNSSNKASPPQDEDIGEMRAAGGG